MNKTLLHIITTLILFSFDGYSQTDKSQETDSTQTAKVDTLINYRTDGTKEFEVQLKNGLKNGNGFLFDQNENIIGLRHYENDTLNGFGFLLNENTFKPKYLYETNKGKYDGVLIEFYENGVIKSFRNADTFNDSQYIRFYENGVIKRIGQTKSGKNHGTWLYFNNNGLLEKKVEYENGNVKN